MKTQRSLALLTRQFVFVTLLCGLSSAVLSGTAQQPYRVLDLWKIGGEGGWDYLVMDSPVHRLYITRADRVDVVDTRNGKIIGTIGGLQGTHAVALDTAGKFGYISNGRENSVVVFDRTSLATLATIPVGSSPDAIIFEPATQSVWAFNGRSMNVSVIDAVTQKVVATIYLDGKPESAVADGQGVIFTNIEDRNEIERLDAHSKTVTANWPLKGCESLSGLAFDVTGHRLFSACEGKKMSVVDSNTGRTLANPAIGDRPDAAGWSAKHKLAFASCGEGVLSVVDAGAADYKTIETLPTQRGARTMAYDPATDRIYLVTAEILRPERTAETPSPRSTMVPGSFTVIVVGR